MRDITKANPFRVTINLKEYTKIGRKRKITKSDTSLQIVCDIEGGRKEPVKVTELGGMDMVFTMPYEKKSRNHYLTDAYTSEWSKISTTKT